MERITQVKHQLDRLLLELEQRETATAHAMESLTTETLTLDNRVRAARAEATMAERFRVLALIDAQIEQLNSAGISSISQRTLRGVVATETNNGDDR